MLPSDVQQPRECNDVNNDSEEGPYNDTGDDLENLNGDSGQRCFASSADSDFKINYVRALAGTALIVVTSSLNLVTRYWVAHLFVAAALIGY